MPHDKPIVPRDACYFLTLNTVDRIDVFVRPAYKEIIVKALNHFVEESAVNIYSWCLMSSHLHLLIGTRQDNGPAYFERDFKKYTTPALIKAIDMEADLRREWMLQRFEDYSKSLKRLEKMSLWQGCSSPLHIDTSQPGLLLDRIELIHENPVKEKVVDTPEMYLYSSARDYAGGKGMVKVKVLQQQGLARMRMLSSN